MTPFNISDTLTLIVILVILYKLNRWYFARRADRKLRNEASRAIEELDAAIQAQRRFIAMQPPPPPPVSVNPARQWSHIPRIAFDYETQMEFGGERYHTVYVTPEEAEAFDIQPGVYITDKRTGPELIGASSQKRFFIPHDQLIQR